jgi:hypothetical protein
MGHSDRTLLTTSVSPLASSDIYVATGHVQEYSVEGGAGATVGEAGAASKSLNGAGAA